MRIDLYTKAVLTIIALATAALALRPVAAGATADGSGAHLAALASTMGAVAKDTAGIAYDLDQLVRGYCRNKKLCGS